MPKGGESYLSGQGQDSVQFGILHLASWVWVDNTPVLRRQNPNHAVFMFGQQPSFYKLIISPSHLLPFPDPNSYLYPKKLAFLSSFLSFTTTRSWVSPSEHPKQKLKLQLLAASSFPPWEFAISQWWQTALCSSFSVGWHLNPSEESLFGATHFSECISNTRHCPRCPCVTCELWEVTGMKNKQTQTKKTPKHQEGKMKFIKLSWNVPGGEWLKWKVTNSANWGCLSRFLAKHSCLCHC